MKSLYFISLLFFVGSFMAPADSVYYCDSTGGKRFHQSKQCRGLQKCTHEIKSTSTSGAKSLGLTQCLIEKQNLFLN